MSNIIGNWLDVSSTSNLQIQTYLYGFMDMSGGNLILRNNNIDHINYSYIVLIH